jgi:HK97 family phage portal protein
MPISSFFNGLKNMWLGTEEMYTDLYIPNLINGSSFDLNKAETVSTVYICIKTLSDMLSKMPLNVYIEDKSGKTEDKLDYRYSLLHYNPNNYTSSQTFFAALEYYRNLKGNSFARIYRDTRGKVISLELIAPSRVSGYVVEKNELYYIIVDKNDKELKLNASELLHFRSLTRDGIWGINPIEAIRLNVSSTYQGLQTIDSFYKNNATAPKAIKSTISGANQQKMIEALSDFKSKYAGAVNAGQLIPLPPNTEIVELALNFADAMFIETVKFNAGQISSLYGVPPHLVGIFEQTKFNNVEQMILEFKATTLTAITRMYRQELEFKLLTTKERLSGKSIEFNLMALVEADSTTRINNLRTLVTMGAITPNDVAINEGYPTFKGGEKHMFPPNYSTFEDKEKIVTPNI